MSGLRTHDVNPFGSAHTAGPTSPSATGRCGSLRESIDMTTYQSLATRAGGEVINGSAY